jgi:hypothetical protein
LTIKEILLPVLQTVSFRRRAVETNLTIPAWLKEIAEAQGVNYSKIFQSALKDYLGINQK